MDELKIKSGMEEKKQKTWSFTIREEDGSSITKDIEEVLDDKGKVGYVISINESGHKKNDKGENEYYNKTEKMYSDTNPFPLAKKEEEKEKIQKPSEIMKTLASSVGKFESD